ncbi:hypothetical protein RAS1_24380 [Phycisphaerae bacterium RAS1]|nr:hypothetical protein RAS1_24380 [Phycisphaerae bacterium RAS1]
MTPQNAERKHTPRAALRPTGRALPPVRRWWRLARVAVSAVLLVIFVHFAYVRYVTPPAAARETAAANTDAALVQRLRQVLRDWPIYTPTLASTQAAFRGWMGNELLLGLQSGWTPASRPELREISAYVGGDALAMVLDRAQRALSSANPTAAAADGAPPSWDYVDRRDQAAIALTVRARWRRMENNDLPGALADLRLALQILAPVSERRRAYEWPGFDIPMFELACLAQETPVPRELAATMIRFLRDELGTSIETWARHMLGVGERQQAFLDRYYTDDGHGDGWLVLSAIDDNFARWNVTSVRRSRAWNVLSPLFRGRRAMAVRLETWQASLEGLDLLGSDEALIRLNSRRSLAARDVFDGPLTVLDSGRDPTDVLRVYNDVARRRACVVMLALAAVRHDRGGYPEDLSALTPAYLDDVPLDAVSHAAMVYVPSADGGYSLKSSAASQHVYMPWWMSGFDWTQDQYSVSRDGAVRSNP